MNLIEKDLGLQPLYSMQLKETWFVINSSLDFLVSLLKEKVTFLN